MWGGLVVPTKGSEGLEGREKSRRHWKGGKVEKKDKTTGVRSGGGKQ